jgi:hypothetical protein
MPNQATANTSGFQLDPRIDSEETVLKIREHALKLLMDGTTIMKWEGEGTTAERQFVAPVSEILAETRKFLKLINPHKYGHVVRQSQMIRCG